MSKIRCYSHRDYRSCFLPRDVLNALGEPQHVKQGYLYLCAATATSAAQNAKQLGLPVRGPHDLRIADNSICDALLNAGMVTDGMVWAKPLSGLQVARVFSTPTGERSTVRVGEFVRLGPGIFRFSADRPAGVTPLVTDAMVDAAYTAYRQCEENIASQRVAMRVALEAALKAMSAES